MHRRVYIPCPIYGIVSVLVAVCCSAVSWGQAYESASYRLSGGGYSSATDTLLVAAKYDKGELKASWLSTYDIARGTMRQYTVNPPPSDFAWVPGYAAFVLTNSDRITLFRKDLSGDRYVGTAVSCPVDILYMSCSWSPDGEWLAINCLDREDFASGRLGLYKFKQEKFVKTGVAIDHRSVIWGKDDLLYATNGNIVLTMKLNAGEPKVVRTIALKERVTLFYGMFTDQPLFQSLDEIRLGDKTLVTLDRPGAKFRVIATERLIFVSASSRCLVVFDHAGHEIDTIDAGRTLHFGAIKDGDTVYALAESTLLRVYVDKNKIGIHEVCNLDTVPYAK